jgi:hypothetical protein
MEPIATTNGTGSSGTITFSGIPQGYKHLQIRMIGKYNDTGVGADVFYVRLNGDTSSSYVSHRLFGTGTSATADKWAYPSSMVGTLLPGGTTSSPNLTNITGNSIIDLLDYSNVNKFKTLRFLGGTEANDVNYSEVGIISGLWQSTSPITSIRIFGDYSFTTTTKISLYGIRG